jgi:hypothetical protein
MNRDVYVIVYGYDVGYRVEYMAKLGSNMKQMLWIHALGCVGVGSDNVLLEQNLAKHQWSEESQKIAMFCVHVVQFSTLGRAI